MSYLSARLAVQFSTVHKLVGSAKALEVVMPCCHTFKLVSDSAAAWFLCLHSSVQTGVVWLVVMPLIFAGSLLWLDWASLVLFGWPHRPTLQDGCPCLISLTHYLVHDLNNWLNGPIWLGVCWCWVKNLKPVALCKLRILLMWTVFLGLFILLPVCHAQRTWSSSCLSHGLPFGC